MMMVVRSFGAGSARALIIVAILTMTGALAARSRGASLSPPQPFAAVVNINWGNATQRLAHFFRWLGGVVPDLHVVVLTRDPAGQSKSAWFAQNPNAASEIAHGNAVFEQTRREPGMPRSFHITHDDLVNKDMRRLARLFGFLSEPFKEKCVREELEKKHSWRS